MKKILLIILILGTSYWATAQEQKKSETVYSFVPQYMINQGIRVDIDKQLNGRHFIQFCPQLYLSIKEGGGLFNNNDSYNSIVGGGINIYHRIYAFEGYDKYGVYLSYGPAYNFFDIGFTNAECHTRSATIHKVGGDILIGYQYILHEVFALDLYAGLGTRVSTMETDAINTDRYNSTSWGYNYSGNLFQLGIRLGIKI